MTNEQALALVYGQVVMATKTGKVYAVSHTYTTGVHVMAQSMSDGKVFGPARKLLSHGLEIVQGATLVGCHL